MDVDAVLAAREGRYKTTAVEKDVEPQYDLGNLLITDLSSVDSEELRYPVAIMIFLLNFVIW